MSTQTMLSVAQICELPSGTKENPTWVNDPFTGICRRIEMKTYSGGSKKMWPCTIGDTTGSASVEITFFAPPKFKEGDQVEFSGKGIRKGDYNGKAQVQIGKDTEVHVIAGAPRVQAAAQSVQVARENQSQAENVVLINGASVGGAVKTVFEALVVGANNQDELKEWLASQEFWASVKRGASDYLRVCQALEKGHLSACSWSGGGRTSQPAAQQQQQAPRSAPSQVERELDEDVPF